MAITTGRSPEQAQFEQERSTIPPLEELKAPLIVFDPSALSSRDLNGAMSYLRRSSWFEDAKVEVLPDNQEETNQLVSDAAENHAIVGVVGRTDTFNKAARAAIGTRAILALAGRGVPYEFHNGHGNATHPEQAHDPAIAEVRRMPALRMTVASQERGTPHQRRNREEYIATYWASFGVAGTLVERLNVFTRPEQHVDQLLREILIEIGEGEHKLTTIGGGLGSEHPTYGHIFLNYPKLGSINYPDIGSETGRPLGIDIPATDLVRWLRDVMDGKVNAWELLHELEKGEHALCPADGTIEITNQTIGSVDGETFKLTPLSRITTGVIEDAFMVLSRKDAKPIPATPFMRRQGYLRDAASALRHGKHIARQQTKLIKKHSS